MPKLSLPATLQLLAAAALAPVARAQPALGTRLLRQPTVSASQVAFVYAGDVWVASREGGDARRLTSFPGVESAPRFSPDGARVIYPRELDGETKIFTVRMP